MVTSTYLAFFFLMSALLKGRKLNERPGAISDNYGIPTRSLDRQTN